MSQGVGFLSFGFWVKDLGSGLGLLAVYLHQGLTS